MLRVVVNHASRQALEIFAREIAPAGTSWSPGTTGPALGRPSASPLIKQFAFTLPKRDVAIRVRLDGEARAVPVAVDGGFRPETPDATADGPAFTPDAEAVQVPLVRLAWARSAGRTLRLTGVPASVHAIARISEVEELLDAGV